MQKYYSGIGSRETPLKVLEDIVIIGAWLSTSGYTLRSGNARGADVAFSKGCDIMSGASEIYLPYKGFNGGCRNSMVISNARTLKQAKEVMKSLKSTSYTWNSNNTPYHLRNVFQVLGVNLNSQSSFVICYTKTGAETEADVISRNDISGTSTAITLANRLGIPVVNMYNKYWMERIDQLVEIK